MKVTRAKGISTRIISAQEISQGTGQLDADGVLHVTLPTEVDAHKRDYRYRIEAHVTDASNREIMGGRGVTVTYSTVVVLLETDRYVYAPGQQADITVHTLDYDSNPVSASVQLKFEGHQSWGSNGACGSPFPGKCFHRCPRRGSLHLHRSQGPLAHD